MPTLAVRRVTRIKSALTPLVPLFALLALTGCPTTTSSTSKSTSPSASPTPSFAGGVKAVKIIFQTGAQGSFDDPGVGSGGLPAQPGSGVQVARLFNPGDNTVIASGGAASSSWPQWLAGFEIGLSGAHNAGSPNPACAGFAAAGEGVGACKWSSGGPAADCGAPQSTFRVSEFDCQSAPATSDGNGGPSDGVYIRAYFSRNPAYLGTSENIMAVVSYAASSLNAAPSAPTQCFSGNTFTPEACSDFTWNAYLKHSATEVPQPFMLFVPPMLAHVDPVAATGGANPSTRQFILPLANDPGLQVFQLSRKHSTLDPTAGTSFQKTCNTTAASAANSPLCAGLVIYSMTLYRI